jgi:hypothetical protein
MMEQMMDNPMVASMMNNPDLMRNLMQSNPEMKKLLDSNPQLRVCGAEKFLLLFRYSFLFWA